MEESALERRRDITLEFLTHSLVVAVAAVAGVVAGVAGAAIAIAAGVVVADVGGRSIRGDY
jgi:hypothetical protein